jgi:hypothetical protein
VILEGETNKKLGTVTPIDVTVPDPPPPPVAAIVIPPAVLVIVIPDPAVNVLKVYPAPFPMGSTPLAILAASMIEPAELTMRRPLFKAVPLLVPPRAMGKIPVVNFDVSNDGISFATRLLKDGVPEAPSGEAKTKFCV